MNKRILFVVILFSALFSFKLSSAQIALEYDDTVICPGTPITMCAALTGHSSDLDNDDGFSGMIPIGFPFHFFGNTYTALVASGNGFVTFVASLAKSYGPWYYGQTPTDEKNCIFVAFADWYLPNGGVIKYAHFGATGHRKFVIEWCHIPAFANGVCNSQQVTTQLILYEGSDNIEMHTTHLPALTGGCPTASPNVRVVQGVEDSLGTTSYFSPDRDPYGALSSNWGTTGINNDARRFVPVGGTPFVYQVDTIPYDPIAVIDSSNSQNLTWYAPNSTTPIDTGACTTVTPTANQNYFLVEYNGYIDCQDTNEDIIDTVHITWGTKHDTLNESICQGEKYNFFGRILDYTGQFDTAFTNSGGCDSFIHLNLQVNPLPIMTLSDTMSNQYFCNGSQGILSVAQPSNDYNYTWKINGQSIPGGNGSSISTVLPGDYRLFITTNEGCSDSSKIVHLSKDTVFINYDFVRHFGCINDTVQIVNNSEPGSSYKWNFGDDSYPPDSTRNPSHVYLNQGVYYVQLIMKDTLGCQDSLMKFVNVEHPFQAAFSVNKDSLCQGTATTVQFTNQSVGAINYHWDFGDGTAVTGVTNPSHQYLLAGNHSAQLIAFDSIGCQDTAYHNIYVDSLPFLKILANKISLCTGEKLYLHLDYLASTAKNVNWSFGDGISWDGTGEETHDYDQAGNYQIIVSAKYSVCPSVSDTLNITVHNLPTVYLGPDTTLCLQGTPIVLSNLDGNPNPLTRYKWNTGDTTPAITVVHPGIYSLTATVFDCSTTESVTIEKDCYTDIPNAFTPNGDGVDDYFFPRQYLSNGVVGFTLTIFNRWGEKIFETQNANGRGWDGNFNGKPQPSGVYVYQMNVIYHNGRTEQYSGNVTLIR